MQHVTELFDNSTEDLRGEITDEMRAGMDMPEVGKEVWWRDDCENGYLDLIAKLR